MNLPIDICLKIEKSPDKEDVLLLLARLENDGVTITNDVYAAIVATLEYTKLAAFLVSRRYGPHQGSPPGVAEKNIAEPRRSNLSVARQSAACPTASAEKCQTVRV